MPLTAFAFLVGGLAFAGVPPFNGWWNEFYTLVNVVNTRGWSILIIVFLFAAFTLTYMIKSFHKIFLGELCTRCEDAREASLGIIIPIIILSALSILIGIYPEIITRIVEALSISFG